MVFETRYKDWTTAALEREAKELLKRLKVEMNKREVDMLTEELAQAEEKGDEEGATEILRKIMALKR